MGRLRYTGEDIRFRRNRKLFTDAIVDAQSEYKQGEDNICKEFGCGKKLSLWEDLYGDKCYFHRTNNSPSHEGLKTAVSTSRGEHD